MLFEVTTLQYSLLTARQRGSLKRTIFIDSFSELDDPRLTSNSECRPILDPSYGGDSAIWYEISIVFDGSVL
jgi:hypothetical protein